MRRLVLLPMIALLSACGGDADANLNAEIGWRFDYSNWKDSAATPDVRGCDNEPASGGSGPAYAPIDEVHLLIEDPEGQVPGVDQVYACSAGIDDRVPVRGLVRQVFRMRIEAKDASGAVLYRHVVPELDLGTLVSETYDVGTATGELHFIPSYGGSGTFPGSVERLRYRLYQQVDGEYAETPTLEGVQEPACSAGLPNDLYIRQIPVDLDPESNMQTNYYKLVLEALDGDGLVIYCGVNPQRAVKLGDSNGWQTETLSAGACP